MDAPVNPETLAADEATTGSDIVRPSKADAEAAVRSLIAWAGADPDREGDP